jgi:4-amino-4-deoxy-L-arabinose transferase-like glycosyltransferase
LTALFLTYLRGNLLDYSNQEANQQKIKSISRWLLVFLLSVYVITAGGHYYSRDGETILAVTRALLNSNSVYVEEGVSKPFYIDMNPTNRYGEILPGVIDKDGGEPLSVQKNDGHLVSASAGILHAILLSPFLLLGKAISLFFPKSFTVYLAHLSTSFFNSLVVALTGVLVFLLIIRLGYRSSIALATSLIFAFATMAWPYSKYDFSEPLLSLFLLLSVYLLVLFKQKLKIGYAFLAGASLGAAISTKIASAINLPLLSLYFLWLLYKAFRRKKALNKLIASFGLFVFGFILLFSLVPVYNYLRFSSWTKTGYIRIKFNHPILLGLYGLLFSPGKGIFLYMPVLILLAFSIRNFLRSHKAEAWLFCSITVITLLFYGRFMDWHGDIAWGPRYLVYTIPYLIIPLAELMSRFSSFKSWARLLVILLIGLSFFVQLVGISVFYNDYLGILLKRYPTLINPNHLNPTRYDYRLSPLLNQEQLVFKWSSRWAKLISNPETYRRVPSSNYGFFNWFHLNVPDFWWVYFSLTSLSRKFLAVLFLPISAAIYSGRKLLPVFKDNRNGFN